MGIETAHRTGNQSFLDSYPSARPRVLVVGCGGAGGNSVHRLHRMGIHGARTMVVNTDAVHLDSIRADRKLLIGGGVTRGMGAGGRPEIGERCAEIAEQDLRNQIGDADLTFITVGLGGGTGTGVAPLVADLAQAAGSVVITLATTPFKAERGRMNNARAGIQRLRTSSDSLIVLDNNRLLDLVPNLPVEQAFAVMDHLIGEVIKGITESITLPSLINLDFSDVRTILQTGGMSTVFYGENSEADVKRLVTDLEEVLLRASEDLGIDATRDGPERGVWVQGRKLASIGLAVHRKVSFHGFALNVTTDLAYFRKIRPCGHGGEIMTSMAEILGKPVDLEDVKASVIVQFQAVFGISLRRVDVSDLLPRPRPPPRSSPNAP